MLTPVEDARIKLLEKKVADIEATVQSLLKVSIKDGARDTVDRGCQMAIEASGNPIITPEQLWKNE